MVSTRRELTIREVGALFGLQLPEPDRGQRSRCKCPFRQHKRRDPTFRVFRSRKTGEPLFKCWSCDPGEPNVGDPVTLYARLAAVERKEAWRRLREEGFAVPGLHEEDEEEGRSSKEGKDRKKYAETQKQTAHVIPVTGSRPSKILPFDMAKWEGYRALREGVLEAFAQKRGMDPEFLRAHGVVEVGGPYVGFTYVNPMTDKPCRIKVRNAVPLNRHGQLVNKVFWVEPRPPKEDTSGARALDVLYLANELRVVKRSPVIIVEGELDALALRSTGILNVVSLPDGNESAVSADLTPIHGRFSIWFLATDQDKAGAQALRVLQARSWGMMVVPIVWKRLKADGEFEIFKDANDALLGGFQRDDFVRCMQVAIDGKGLSVAWQFAD
jgi:hypothetical protein